MKRLISTNLLLGMWLMASPFVLRLIYQGTFEVTWVDFIFGFFIAVISYARLLSYTEEEILLTDWMITAVAVLTVLNPLLYNYYGTNLASLNNMIVGGAVVLFAGYVDWKDSHRHL